MKTEEYDAALDALKVRYEHENDAALIEKYGQCHRYRGHFDLSSFLLPNLVLWPTMLLLGVFLGSYLPHP